MRARRRWMRSARSVMPSPGSYRMRWQDSQNSTWPSRSSARTGIRRRVRQPHAGAVLHPHHRPPLAPLEQALEPGQEGRRQGRLQLLGAGLQAAPGHHLVLVLGQEDGFQLVELLLGLRLARPQLLVLAFQGLDALLRLLQGLGRRLPVALALVQLPDGGGVLDLLGGSLHRGLGQFLGLLGAAQLGGEGALLGPGGGQALGGLLQLPGQVLEFRVQGRQVGGEVARSRWMVARLSCTDCSSISTERSLMALGYPGSKPGEAPLKRSNVQP